MCSSIWTQKEGLASRCSDFIFCGEVLPFCKKHFEKKKKKLSPIHTFFWEKKSPKYEILKLKKITHNHNNFLL
jgi:hypothetical protein